MENRKNDMQVSLFDIFDAPERPRFERGGDDVFADRMGRDSVMIELNSEYAEIARRRIVDDTPALFADMMEVEVA
jgi:hypothetical protein